jgi:hypothetical protein
MARWETAFGREHHVSRGGTPAGNLAGVRVGSETLSIQAERISIERRARCAQRWRTLERRTNRRLMNMTPAPVVESDGVMARYAIAIWTR